MSSQNFSEASDFIRNNLRLKTFPVAVKFLKDEKEFPEKTRRPAQALGKRIALCQAVSMARLYGWTVGLTREDLICVPAALAFGMSDATDAAATMARLFCEGAYLKDMEAAQKEVASIIKLEKAEYPAIVLAPLHRASFDPDTIVFYGNPAQVMRMTQSWSFHRGERVRGNFGGKIECSEYLIAPFKERAPRIAVPGMGDRVFSLTQDDEMVFALPGAFLKDLLEGLREAGKKVGAQYPLPVFLNFQPEFPPAFKAIGKEIGLL
jgi:uncharacterized protein (DUF169 family)